MLFLSEKETLAWSERGQLALANLLVPEHALDQVRTALRPHFCFYIGSLLAAHGNVTDGKQWLQWGADAEPVPLNAYFLNYLERHGDQLTTSQPVFADPRPYVHFSTLPPLQRARQQFIQQSAASLPPFGRPLRFIDMGCGDGALTRDLLGELCRRGNADGVQEIFLAEPSERMLELAQKNLSMAFPETRIVALRGRSEEVCSRFPSDCDLAISSLAWHHMPAETKQVLARRLAEVVDHVLLFEIEGNHDTPELDSPALAVSLYQLYGGAVALVLAHEAPQEVIQASADAFLIGEMISVITQPRGLRTEYHMLRRQWIDLLNQGLGAEFECRADHTCYCDGYVELYLLHYGRR